MRLVESVVAAGFDAALSGRTASRPAPRQVVADETVSRTHAVRRCEYGRLWKQDGAIFRLKPMIPPSQFLRACAPGRRAAGWATVASVSFPARLRQHPWQASRDGIERCVRWRRALRWRAGDDASQSRRAV